MKRFILAVFLAGGLASLASANYHFVHFSSRSAPWQVYPEKFDINVLPGRTLSWFVGSGANLQVGTDDSYTAVLSQLRAAADVWNRVPSSDLRLAFGGFLPQPSSDSVPSIQIEFGEVAPGIVAYGGPTAWADWNSQYVPVIQSKIVISQDLRERPSFSEALFGSLVHEFGHALGLQHTQSSGVMSILTRATSKGHPLSADDVAGISLLYPTSGYSEVTGTIRGQVSMRGSGVNLASVVAISPSGEAISTLSNPDGSYRLAGLPPGDYFVYVHPLPPGSQTSTPGDIILPRDRDRITFESGPPFETVFYSVGSANGVKLPPFASLVSAGAGKVTTGIDFNVVERSGYGISAVETYGFPGTTAIRPPYLSPGMRYPFFVATGSGLVANNAPVGGLRASVLGGPDAAVSAYKPLPSYYVRFDFDQQVLAVPSNSPRHLVLSANNDIYVLPSAFYHVAHQPPQILDVSSLWDDDRNVVVVRGTDFTSGTKIFFDGVPATVRRFEDNGSSSSRMVVVPPPGPAGYRAALVAVNEDGQSSLFNTSDAPPRWTYSGSSASTPQTDVAVTQSTLTVSPSVLYPDTEALIQIDSTTGSFPDGPISLAFGCSDIAVTRLWAVGPNRIFANVRVAYRAQPRSLNLTLWSGLQIFRQEGAVSLQTPSQKPFWLVSNILDTTTGLPSIMPGNYAAIQVVGSPTPLLSAGSVTVLLNAQRVPAIVTADNQVVFQVPDKYPTGLTTLRLEAGSDRSLPIGLTIDPRPQ